MEWKTVFYGAIASSESFVFIVIQECGDVVSLWCIDELPQSMDNKIIQGFINEYDQDGWSVSGNWKQVMEELKEIIG